MLNPKKKYLQIALNSTLDEAQRIIGQIPLDERIIIEAGTPLIKAYGIRGIRDIRFWWQQRVYGYAARGLAGVGQGWAKEDFKELEQMFVEGGFLGEKMGQFLERKRIKKGKNENLNKIPFNPYIVADLKCMDRGAREVEIAKQGGAGAAVSLGHAPIETLDAFIDNCERFQLDSMIDMMNVEYPLSVLRQLKKPPHVVILHRGVDEEVFDAESEIPYHEIYRIKENYDIMVGVAGGDTFQEVQSSIFNDADIVVVWKSFYQSTAETAKLAKEFLKEIR